MKLLLTSAGLTNTTIVKALEKLLGRTADGVKLAFIPTAANVEPGEKDWLIDDLVNFKKNGFSVDIVDISAIDQKYWLPRIETAEVLVFGGGNTMHLKYWMQKSGLEKKLHELLLTKVYVGISAGSCVTGPTINNSVQNLFEETYEQTIHEGLELVDFQFVPHLNSEYFRNIRYELLETASAQLSEPVYAIDDNSALIFDNGFIEIVSEGEWVVYN